MLLIKIRFGTLNSHNTYFQAITSAMQRHDSGLEVRNRNWLKITIPQAFIGAYFVHIHDDIIKEILQ